MNNCLFLVMSRRKNRLVKKNQETKNRYGYWTKRTSAIDTVASGDSPNRPPSNNRRVKNK